MLGKEYWRPTWGWNKYNEIDPNSNQPLHVTTAWPNDQNIFPLLGAAAYSNLCNPLYKKIVFKGIECRGIVSQTAILKFVIWFCRGWPLWIQMGHVGGRRAFAKSSAAHQPPWAPWAALALSSPEHSVSSEQRRTPEQRKTESVEQRAPMGKLLRLLWFHLVSVIFLQRVLKNKGDKSICPVLSTQICQKSYFETTILQYCRFRAKILVTRISLSLMWFLNLVVGFGCSDQN